MKRLNNSFDLYNTDTKHYREFFPRAIVCLCLLSSHLVIADEIPNLTKPQIVVPEKIAGVTTLSAEQVLEALRVEHPPLLIDARIKKDRNYGYIESSISLPDINTNCDSLTTVSANKNTPLIFYCNGIQCGRSVISIKIARSCGYHHLSWFKGGFAEWKEKGYQYITTLKQ